jgi:histone H3/H4
MSYSAKEEIQRMVKIALKPRYVDKTINKDQYTDINRDISRRMYDLVGDASALADHNARERWQGMAAEEVRKAVAGLATQQQAATSG